jgi:hypothetical protein
MKVGRAAWTGSGSGVSRAIPMQQFLSTIPAALRAPSTVPEATPVRGGMPSEASSEAVAEDGMQPPRTAEIVTAATTEAAAFRTAAGPTEATLVGGRGAAPEAGTGLDGRS